MPDKNDLREVKKPKKEKSDRRKFRRTRETWSELKKVTWPTPGTVAKSTGVVLMVVAIFMVVLLAFDLILMTLVFNPLINGSIGFSSNPNAEEIFGMVGRAISMVFGRSL